MIVLPRWASYALGGVWSPASEFGTAGLWFVGDSGVTLGTQPVIANPGFEADPLTGWLPAGTATLTRSTSSPYAGAACLNVAGASGDYARQAIHTVGCRYRTTLVARGDGTTSPRVWGGAYEFFGTSSTAWQPVAIEYTAGHSELRLYNVGAAGNVGFDSVTSRCISATLWTPRAAKGALGTFPQATPANMGWRSTTQLNGHYVLQFDGAADHYVSDVAAALWALHKAAGFAVSFLYKPNGSAANTDTILDTCNATATNHGITLEYDATNTQLTLKVANGSGGFEQNVSTGAATLTKNAWHYVSVSWSQAAGARILIDAAAAVTAASGGAASTNDATATLQLGRTSGGANFLHGEIDSLLISVGALSNTGLARWHAHQKSWGGL